MTDYTVTPHGGLFLVEPLTPEARTFLTDTTDPAESTFYDGCLVVERRYIIDYVAWLQDEGFEVS